MSLPPETLDNEWDLFLATFVQELIAMPDDQFLDKGEDVETVRAHGMRLLKQALNKKDVNESTSFSRYCRHQVVELHRRPAALGNCLDDD